MTSNVRKMPDRSVRHAAEAGLVPLLRALRRRLAEAIDDGPSARDLNLLARRLLEVARELEALDPGEDVRSAPAPPDEPLDVADV